MTDHYSLKSLCPRTICPLFLLAASGRSNDEHIDRPTKAVPVGASSDLLDLLAILAMLLLESDVTLFGRPIELIWGDGLAHMTCINTGAANCECEVLLVNLTPTFRSCLYHSPRLEPITPASTP